MKYYLGIDIGGTAVKAGIITENGEVIEKRSLSANINNYQVPLLERVKKAALEIKTAAQKKEFEIQGIGVSAAGQIDSNKGMIIGDNGHIPDWKGTNLKREIEELTDLKTEVENDANCAAIAEKWIGNARDYKDIIIYTIGTGIGAGIIIDNQIFNGSRGIGGEIGHMIIEHQGRKCSCGNRGCFEQYASMTALVRDVKKELKLDQEIDGKYIFEELKAKNDEIKKVVDQFLNYHATAIISLLHIFNPEAVIIGGGVSAQKELLIKPLEEIVRAKAMPAYTEEFTLKTAALSNDAGMIGAVKNFIERH
ncbi:glucokinase [Halanaerobium congolense]|jgi:glucokinase|uniref:Glucokinase n=1 Tax=Halanaerobium congolense TaxID=54121 RepID=A0A1G8ICF9_9FIRM|nr:ROK family protein [Halanaerobium congolense]PUU91169.1 MAG: Glucokinase [Halanaerobium sp.]SDI16240.1 glucokinase [Halanaerobium congolense]SES73838.1 glucokinase [Halanaerobium congolense]